MTHIEKKKRLFWPVLAGYLAGLATAGLVALMPKTPEPGTVVPTSSAAPSPAAPASSVAVSPRPSSTPASSSVAPASMPQHAPVPLSAEARDRIVPLEAKLVADAGDLLARKQLALILLQNQQLMAAYEHGTKILAAHPDDPDGLYVHGVVRLAMGHAPLAIELLDKVLARYPNHVMALQARAQAQRKIGDEGGAALTEARAREATRGDNSKVDALLDAASDGSLLEMMRSGTTASLAPSEPVTGTAIATADGK